MEAVGFVGRQDIVFGDTYQPVTGIFLGFCKRGGEYSASVRAQTHGVSGGELWKGQV